MLTKRCPNCGQIKTEEHFYHRSGKKSYLLRSYCKECEAEKKKQIYWDNPEVAREYAKIINLHHRDKMREYNKKHYKEIRDTEWRKNQIRKNHKAYRLRNPQKNWCRAKTNNAIISGKIKRQPCEICGNQKSQAHHDDYSKPFHIRWLCRNCHRQLHQKLRNSDIKLIENDWGEK